MIALSSTGGAFLSPFALELSRKVRGSFFAFADYRDPEMRDVFHRAACDTFDNLSQQHPFEVTAATDPDVTASRLWTLFQKCQFIFYWGHGLTNAKDGPVVLGSRQDEHIPVSRIRQELGGKLFFGDACSIANDLNGEDFCQQMLICPAGLSAYNTSVIMGCRLVSYLFDSRMAFDVAFYRATENIAEKNLYRLVGMSTSLQVSVSDSARESIVQAITAFAQHGNDHQGDRSPSMLSQEEVAGFGYQLFEEIINKGNLGAIDHCFTTTCIEHYASPVPLPNGLDVRNYIATLHATFPDIHYTIEDEYAIGGKAMYLVKGHGTMTSEFFGIAPTAKYGTWEEIHITALRDNKAVEHWAIIDFVGMVLSLGILPKPVKTANE